MYGDYTCSHIFGDLPYFRLFVSVGGLPTPPPRDPPLRVKQKTYLKFPQQQFNLWNSRYQSTKLQQTLEN